MKLKHLSSQGIPSALTKAERYRLLNEPEEAESICLDVLAADPDNREARIVLLLSRTDQFGRHAAVGVRDAQSLISELATEYDREYYSGLIAERWAKAQIVAKLPGHATYQWIRAAMTHYERAETLAPTANQDAILRWNACVRVLQQNPHLTEKEEEFGEGADEPPR
jgi:hypothetical protein